MLSVPLIIRPLIAAAAYFFCLDTKEAKNQVIAMLPPALPVLNAFSGCLAVLASREKAKPSFPPYARPAAMTGQRFLGRAAVMVSLSNHCAQRQGGFNRHAITANPTQTNGTLASWCGLGVLRVAQALPRHNL
jgi:hypothetical protein